MLLLMTLTVGWKELPNNGFEKMDVYAASPETLGCLVHKLIPMQLAFLTPRIFLYFLSLLLFPFWSISLLSETNQQPDISKDMFFSFAFLEKKKTSNIIRTTRFLNILEQFNRSQIKCFRKFNLYENSEWQVKHFQWKFRFSNREMMNCR